MFKQGAVTSLFMLLDIDRTWFFARTFGVLLFVVNKDPKPGITYS